MYPYHPRIKQRIRAGELIGYHFTDNYPRIGPALVLEFNTYPPLRPITALSIWGGPRPSSKTFRIMSGNW